MENQETKESKTEERKTKSQTKAKSKRAFAIPCDTFNPNDRSLAEGAD